jgi:flagellar hook-associated protein 1 FlgK
VTRISDQQVLYAGATPPAAAIDGVTFTFSGTPQAGDHFLIRPSALGANSMSVAITDRSKIAAAAPIRTAAGATNTGTGVVSAGTVNSPPPVDPNLQQPITIQFTSPTTFDVIGTVSGGPATTGLPYTPGQDITFNGWTVQVSGAPNVNDTFTVGPNTNGVGDSRNALALGALQTAKTMDNGTASYQGVFGQLVSSIGNKTHELEVTNTAEKTLLTQATAAQQEQSGVNLDEEATNLIKYQQAYAAAGKVMATAQKMFDILLSLGAV